MMHVSEIQADYTLLSRAAPTKLTRLLEGSGPAHQLEAGWQLRWLKTARKDQLWPTIKRSFFCWTILAGRGWGKTRVGAETLAAFAYFNADVRCAVIAATFDDCRKTCFEGVSGLLAVLPASFIKNYNRTTLELWLINGSKLQGFSAEKPDRLRGPQHHAAWCDELAAWKYTVDTWDNLILGLRLGENPWVIVTTTPKPKKLLRELVNEEDTVVTKGSTYDNAANLPKKFLEKLTKRYKGTRTGRQELYAELLDQAEGALWTRKVLDDCQVRYELLPVMVRIVVALDPATTSGENSDEFGIIVAGLGEDGHGYVLEDRTGRYTPAEWAKLAITLYVKHHADLIIGEANNGGDMIENTIRTADHPLAKKVNYRKVHASKGKHTRAEPVSALYEKGEVHHVLDTRGEYIDHTSPHSLADLEDELCSWEPLVSTDSPNRLDAMVWGITELMLSGEDPYARDIVAPVQIAATSSSMRM